MCVCVCVCVCVCGGVFAGMKRSGLLCYCRPVRKRVCGERFLLSAPHRCPPPLSPPVSVCMSSQLFSSKVTDLTHCEPSWTGRQPADITSYMITIIISVSAAALGVTSCSSLLTELIHRWSFVSGTSGDRRSSLRFSFSSFPPKTEPRCLKLAETMWQSALSCFRRWLSSVSNVNVNRQTSCSGLS